MKFFYPVIVTKKEEGYYAESGNFVSGSNFLSGIELK